MKPGGGVELTVFEVVRRVTITDFDIKSLRILMGPEKDDALSLLVLQIAGSFSHSSVSIENCNEMSIVIIDMYNLYMTDVKVKHYVHFNGRVGLRLENVTWVNTNDGFMELDNAVSVKMTSSNLTLNCDTCSAIIMHGVYFNKFSWENKFWNVTESILIMIETIFKTHARVQDKIQIKSMKIVLTNSTFNIEGSMSFFAREFIVSNTLIQCSTSQMARRIVGTHHIFYECSPTCAGNTKYS